MDNETEQSAIEDFLHVSQHNAILPHQSIPMKRKVAHYNTYKQILEEHRKNCEQQGKYVEAEIAKNRLDELKVHEEKRQEEAMKARQISDMLGVEEAHLLEFKQFNINWDQKMSEFEEKATL